MFMALQRNQTEFSCRRDRHQPAVISSASAFVSGGMCERRAVAHSESL